MKDASQYPIKWRFGLTAPAPWSKTRPHLGCDRSCPPRTPLFVNGQLIAYTGSTGGVDPHLHIQKVVDGLVVDPKDGGFNIPTPAKVFDAGVPTGKEQPGIGKHIRIRDANGVEWSYFHLDEIKVKVGDKIGDDMKMSSGTVENLYLSGWQRKATAEEHKRWDGKEMEEFFYAGGKNQYQWLWDEIKRRDVRIKALEETSSPALIKLAEAIRELK